MTSVLESGSFKGFGAVFASGFASSIVSSSIESLGQTGEVLPDGSAKPNSFGKSDWFKASMIPSGGVSGGFSSIIAGGNFMDGFRQGLITSGLNHVATMAANEINGDEEYEALNKQFKKLVKSNFNNSFATFTRTLSHEFYHVMLFKYGVADFLSKNAREVLAYHHQIFSTKLPKAPYAQMEGYYTSAKKYFDQLTSKEIQLMQSVYNDYIKSGKF